ncbi:hypothetical protein C8Q78DRAFT_51623 [Trametes maxima]|nr:hypothetical protein C8Q78DRAFT_51623 [Trametes maxima]
MGRIRPRTRQARIQPHARSCGVRTGERTHLRARLEFCLKLRDCIDPRVDICTGQAVRRAETCVRANATRAKKTRMERHKRVPKKQRLRQNLLAETQLRALGRERLREYGPLDLHWCTSRRTGESSSMMCDQACGKRCATAVVSCVSRYLRVRLCVLQIVYLAKQRVEGHPEPQPDAEDDSEIGRTRKEKTEHAAS